ncbi:hypothetical protein [Spirosoma radiotolerans]|uniref:Haem-binding uptake Tiki superfamily ChaN domain-containing protein n=1 Tax=Spirosoma radiotolerans TaxID=1379870 RepID=A0A0E3ZV59_9BACT|nr:hypothetical protein [Spirosoma radiotolerans]AKD55948.1 hypothetical protein SD10_14595 [Spirosoma radiotolerans]
MSRTSQLLVLIAFLFTFSTGFAQQPDTLWTRLLKENTLLLQPSAAGFTGKGWNLIQAGVKDNQYVLIGEDHFMSEIPYFTEQVLKTASFNTFALEVDPYVAQLLNQKLAQSDTTSLMKWAVQAGPALSFYSLQEEFHMLREASRTHTSLIGLDQVMMMSDQLLYNELAHKATRPSTRQRYAAMTERATISATKATLDLSHPMYMQSAAFDQDVAALAKEPMTAYEKEVLDAVQLSARIYKTQSHALRVQLMKHQLMSAYVSSIKDKKVLVKLGAMHCARGESYLTVYDCGSLLSNLAESEYKSSYHIAIFGKNGIQGSPFKALPAHQLDPVNGDLKFIKPFFEATPEQNWVVFNLLPIRKALQRQKLNIDDVDLRRTILGYDALVIFPTAHPAHSMN